MQKKKTFLDSVCNRCGSPKRISQVWKQSIELYSGRTEDVEMSQIVCTNIECQAKFDTNRAEELAKYTARKLAKEEQDKIRKGNAAISLANTRKNKAAMK